MIFHVCRKESWENEKDQTLFGQEEMDRYGFIHSSTRKGLERILGRFENKEDYVVLLIDEESIKDKIVYEEKDRERLYPHFYEKIDTSCIKEVKELSDL